MKDEYNFSRMKYRPNPYAQQLKQQSIFDKDVEIILKEKVLSNEYQRQRLNEMIRLMFATP